MEWQTDEPSRGWAKAGAVTALADELATTHSVQLVGLSASTAYTAEVRVTDATGNGPTVKSVSFTTAATADTIAPVILEGPTVTASTASGMVVEWMTSEPAKGALTYGAGSALGSSVAETLLSVAHRIELAGLTPNTAYSVRASATDAAGNGPTLSRIKSGRTLPAADTAPPVIVNGPLVSDITDTAATVAWKTDESSTGGVSWNDGVVYGVLTDDKLDISHSARITGLASGKTYHLTVSSKDALGNGPTLSKTVDFSTQAAADTTAPAILAGPTVTGITNQSAVIQWDTDEPSDSQLAYGTSAANLDKSDSRAALTKKHSLPLVGLAASTAYSVQVKSRDQAGNTSAPSAILGFTTAASADTSLPVFDAPPQVGYTTSNKAVVQWKTDKPTDSQVTITPVSFDEPPRINSEGVLKDLHEISLTGLTPNKTYSVSVTSTDLSGNSTTQELASFSTPPSPDSVVPQIVAGPSVQPAATTATVIWSTDKLADSKASYGPSGSSLAQVSGDIAYTRQHSVVLAKLVPGTAYQVRVSSSDPSGNASQSGAVNFTTTADGSGTTGSSTTSTGATSTTTTTGVTTTTGLIVTTTTGVTTTTVGSTSSTTLGAITGVTLNLASGWNLAGNGQGQSVDVAALFGDTMNVITVWKWVAAKAAWAFYAPSLTLQQLADYAAAKGYEVLGAINAGEGYWVNAKQAFTTTFSSATPVASASFAQGGARALSQGWSLIATGDNPSAAVFNNALSQTPPTAGTTPANLTTLWAWDTPQAGWYFYAPSLAAQGGAALSAYIASKGYLDFSTANKTLGNGTGFWVNR